MYTFINLLASAIASQRTRFTVAERNLFGDIDKVLKTECPLDSRDFPGVALSTQNQYFWKNNLLHNGKKNTQYEFMRCESDVKEFE